MHWRIIVMALAGAAAAIGQQQREADEDLTGALAALSEETERLPARLDDLVDRVLLDRLDETRKRDHVGLDGGAPIAAALAASPAEPFHLDGDEGLGPRADSHAPIGVMGDHVHGEGEWMVSYRFMHMEMKGNRSRTDRMSPSEVLQEFPVTPVRMSMQMHMLGVMYAPADEVTLMAMVPYVRKEMDHVTRTGVRFTTRSEGIGDVKLAGLISIFDEDGHHIHLTAGVSLPTGSIDREDDTPAGRDQTLPYPMQIGSGTFDVMPGVTYTGSADDFSWGAQLMGTLRLGRNSEEYSLGDVIEVTTWGAWRWAAWISTSIRLDFRSWGNIDGADSRLNPAMIPTAAPDLRGGTRLDIGIGVNLLGTEGFVESHRLAVEVLIPIYQNLEGPQLENDWTIIAGWQLSF